MKKIALIGIAMAFLLPSCLEYGSTATRHKDKTITLFELDMDAMMEDPKNLKKVMKLGPIKPGTRGDLLKEIKGIKAETEKEVVVVTKCSHSPPL